MSQWEKLIFPHPVGPVKIIETHISTVVLTGDYAYKIKKPVNFGFVDFSTLEKRKFFCYEELRLNKRLAPEIYLEVVRIDEELRIDGCGKIIDYAVKMIEFSQKNLFNNLAESKSLKNDSLDELATEIAKFHRNIPSSVTGDWGLPETVEKSVFENFHHFENTKLFEAANEIKLWSQDKFHDLKNEILLRKKNGFVRECHGDLHLGNIALIGNKPVLFDCIEFNENFRWIDVMSEIAFLIMDMEEIKLTGGAYRILNRYLEYTGDYSGLKLLTFYLSYRAMVRAKVAILQKKDPSLYIELAKTFTVPKKNGISITYGLSGSGKSFTSSLLMEEIPAIRIRSDVERKRNLKNSTDIYSPEKIGGIYSILLQHAKEILEAGFSVIVDATFLKKEHRDSFKVLAEKFSADFSILDFECPVEVLESRIRSRMAAGFDPSDADINVLHAQIAAREKLTADEIRYAKRMPP